MPKQYKIYKEEVWLITIYAIYTTDQPFECLSIHTVGGFSYHNCTKKYLHIVIDHGTGYVRAILSKSVTTETYINYLNQVFYIQYLSNYFDLTKFSIHRFLKGY